MSKELVFTLYFYFCQLFPLPPFRVCSTLFKLYIIFVWVLYEILAFIWVLYFWAKIQNSYKGQDFMQTRLKTHAKSDRCCVEFQKMEIQIAYKVHKIWFLYAFCLRFGSGLNAFCIFIKTLHEFCMKYEFCMHFALALNGVCMRFVWNFGLYMSFVFLGADPHCTPPPNCVLLSFIFPQN